MSDRGKASVREGWFVHEGEIWTGDATAPGIPIFKECARNPHRRWGPQISREQADALLAMAAAAPDLYEALEALVALYDTDEGCTSLPQYIAARAALSRARGEGGDHG